MQKHLIKCFAVMVSFLIATIAVADDCLPVDYQELKDLPQDALHKELCSAKGKLKSNKAVGAFHRQAAEMHGTFRNFEGQNRNNETASDAYRAAAICEKQVDRIQRQLVQKGVADEAIEGFCSGVVK